MVCHLLMLCLLLALYWAASPYLSSIYLIGIGAVAGLLVYEHWLVKPTDLTRVNLAFFQVNAVVSVGLLVIVLIVLAVGCTGCADQPCEHSHCLRR